MSLLKILGMETIDEKPTENSLPPGIEKGTINAKREYLRSIAAKIVDMYAIDNESVNSLTGGPILHSYPVLLIYYVISLYK